MDTHASWIVNKEMNINTSTQSTPPSPSRYENQKRRDWNTFCQYLRNHRPPLSLPSCSGAHVLEFLRYLDQFGKTKVHHQNCAFFGLPNPPAPCPCPLRQAWGSLDALIGRLRAAYEENGGPPEANPFGSRAVRLYLREVRDFQAKARGVSYDKKRKRVNRQKTQTLPQTQPPLPLQQQQPHQGHAPDAYHVFTGFTPAVVPVRKPIARGTENKTLIRKIRHRSLTTTSFTFPDLGRGLVVSKSLFLCCCLPDNARWEPSSDYCGNKTIGQGMGYPLPSQLAYGANRVELYRCTFFPAITRFPWHNDPLKVTKSDSVCSSSPSLSKTTTKEESFRVFKKYISLSMANARGDDLAESLKNLFTSVSSMVKSELQGTNNQLDLLEKMNLRVAAEYDDLGDVAAGLRVFAEQMKSKSGGLDEFVGQMDAIEKQVSEFEAVISVLDRYVSVLESKVRAECRNHQHHRRSNETVTE
ncbi:unnamed protein product [Brassica rapa]|uniref:ALOG domain-containing protein n=2 Tax=Brassica campestris TaxID=3711 RepID=A0A8D9CK82_BRACM|nr:unnamed protein product [Brassica rapa]